MSTPTLTRRPAGRPRPTPAWSAQPPRTQQFSPRVWRTAKLVAAAALAVVWFVPLAWAVVTSIRPEPDTIRLPLSWIPSEITFDAYASVLAAGDIPRWFVNSTVVTVLVTALTLLTSTMAAYGLSRARFRGARPLLLFIVAGIMVPPQILVVPLFDQMLALGLVDTYWGIVLPQVAAPVMVFVLKRFFDGLPHEMEEAARVDGASHWRIFWQVVLPLSRSVISAVGVFVFVGAWNNFMWPFLVTSNPELMTLPVGLVNVQSDWGLQYARVMASAVLAAIPLVVVFAFAQQQIIRGIATTGLSGN